MRYLLLIYNTEPSEGVPDEAMGAELEAYNSFTNWTREKGYFEAGEALQPTATATTVRVENGRTITTDGPFAETKEQLGGFYLVECRDIDEAIDLAARIPGATHGSIEIRPIWDLPSGTSAEAVAVAG
ncbi:MAG TPA: YciI family protein [Candidatus Limnocylindrales bacterium]